MLPDNAAKECRDLGKCALAEYKGYWTCSLSGSCSQAESEAFKPLKIRTNYDYPPIPIRDMDWSATLDGYEGGDPIGRGHTEDEAIADLKDQLDD